MNKYSLSQLAAILVAMAPLTPITVFAAGSCQQNKFTDTDQPQPAKPNDAKDEKISSLADRDPETMQFDDCQNAPTNACNLTMAMEVRFYAQAIKLNSAPSSLPSSAQNCGPQSAAAKCSDADASKAAAALFSRSTQFKQFAACLKDSSAAGCKGGDYGVAKEQAELSVSKQNDSIQRALKSAQKFADRFQNQGDCLANAGSEMAKMAAADNTNSTNSNSLGDGKSGITGDAGSAMDNLNKILPLATLGVMGLGVACSMQMISQCQQQSQSTDPSTNTQSNATSPTPSSASTSTQVSNLGNTAATTSSPLGVSDAPATSTSQMRQVSSADPVGATYADSTNPYDTTSRGLASSSGSSGGYPSGGSSSGSGAASAGANSPVSGDAAKAQAAADAAKNTSDGSYPLPTGSGSAGGASLFSLNSNPSASSADAALKNILNGDAPAGGAAALAGLADLGAANAIGAAAGIDAQSSENTTIDENTSIFQRIRATHLRCLKRGCVGFGDGGNNI